MAFKLEVLAITDQPVNIPLLDPVTGIEIEDEDGVVEIVMYGKSSKQYKQALAVLQNKNLLAKNKKTNAKQIEDLNNEFTELLVAVVKEITNLLYENEPVNNSDVIRRLLTDDRYIFVRTQIENALEDLSNFINKQKTN